jgi:hypothetical protein
MYGGTAVHCAKGRSVAEQNMGRATTGASQIYAVVRPERNEVEREGNRALAYSSEIQYL